MSCGFPSLFCNRWLPEAQSGKQDEDGLCDDAIHGSFLLLVAAWKSDLIAVSYLSAGKVSIWEEINLECEPNMVATEQPIRGKMSHRG